MGVRNNGIKYIIQFNPVVNISIYIYIYTVKHTKHRIIEWLEEIFTKGAQRTFYGKHTLVPICTTIIITHFVTISVMRSALRLS